MNVPANLRYADSHEWLRAETDGTVTIGITDHAQAALGDLVFVELPAVGRQLKAGEACAIVESVKAASDVYAPVSGTVTEGNQAVVDEPSLVNTDPEGEGWFFRLTLSDTHELNGLMNAEQYQAYCADL